MARRKDHQPSNEPPQKRSPEEMLALRGKGMSLRDIGRLSGCSKQNVAYVLKHHGARMERITAFRADESNLLSEKRKKLWDALDDEKVSKMSGKEIVLSAAILIDKERLISGAAAAGGNISLLVIANRVHQQYQFSKGGEVVEVGAEPEVVSPPPDAVDGEIAYGEA